MINIMNMGATTLLPSEDLVASLAGVSAALAANQPVQLPEQFTVALRQMVGTLSRGEAVLVASQRTTLSTQEAADLLGISRPTLVKLLDDGKISSERLTDRHRRVQLADVLAYQRQRRRDRSRALDEITRESEDIGLYDTTADEYLDALRRVRGKS